MITFCVFLILCCNLVQGQFPRVCTTDDAFNTKTCCPLWKDGSPCGSRSGRGMCNWIKPEIASFTPGIQHDDDRLDWPKYYYTKICECFLHYSDYDCGNCKYGYYGEKCDRNKTIVRKEIRELTLLERKRLFSYFMLAKVTKSPNFVILTTGNRHQKETYQFVDASVYDIFSWIHYYSTKLILTNGTFNGSTNYAHQGPAFPGWHRLGLLFLERQIQVLTGDEDFAMPYYDWREEKNCSICTNDFFGDSDVQGFLSKYSHFALWKSICSGYNYDDAYCLGADDLNQMEKLHRRPGANPYSPNLPTSQDVENTLKWKDFDSYPYDRKAPQSFRNVLEGFMNPSDGVTPQTSMHNMVHNFFGGTMSEVPISSNDPMFIMHHCFIDKIFEEWIHRHNGNPDMYPKNDQPGQGPEECSTPYFPCYMNKRFLRRSTNYGYIYSKYHGM